MRVFMSNFFASSTSRSTVAPGVPRTIRRSTGHATKRVLFPPTFQTWSPMPIPCFSAAEPGSTRTTTGMPPAGSSSIPRPPAGSASASSFSSPGSRYELTASTDASIPL